METYLIRVYRRDANDPERITGTVEKIGTEKSMAFKDIAELGKIITGKRQNKKMGGKDHHLVKSP